MKDILRIPDHFVIWAISAMVIVMAVISGCRPGDIGHSSQSETRLDVLQQYADRVLEYGWDQWSGKKVS